MSDSGRHPVLRCFLGSRIPLHPLDSSSTSRRTKPRLKTARPVPDAARAHPRSLRGNRNRTAPDTRKLRQFPGCNGGRHPLALPVRRRGQPSRSKPGGRAVEVTRKSVRPGDERPAGAANLFNRRSRRRAASLRRDATGADRRGRPRHRQRHGHSPPRRGHGRRVGRQRRLRAAQAAVRASGRRGDRPDAARRGWLADHRGAALRGRDHPHHHDQRPRIRARQGARAAHRRRRLPGKALWHARAGGPGRGGAAALRHGAVRSRLGQGRGAGPGRGRRPAPGAPRRRGCRSHAHRVSPPVGARGRIGQGAHARPAPAAGVGHAVPVSRPHGRRVRAQAAPEARPALRVAHLHPDPPRRGLPVRAPLAR